MAIFKSLKFRLLVTLMLALGCAWLATLMVGYRVTAMALNVQLDERLRLVAASLAEVESTSETVFQARSITRSPERGETRVEFQILRHERIVTYSEHAPSEVLASESGYSEKRIADKTWRVFATATPQSRIAVGEDMAARNALIHALVFSTLWPLLAAGPLLGTLLWFSVAVGLRPLIALRSAIDKRSPETLTLIELKAIPSEVVPLVESLNRLMGMLTSAMSRERQFTDDAAHELKTPLAAIKIQTQMALRASSEAERQAALVAVNQGVDRAGRMVTQLLTLARLEPERVQLTFTLVNLSEVVAAVIAQLTPRALAKHIDLGLDQTGPGEISGDVACLELLVTNLLDNAIRYTPKDGLIDVRVRRDPNGTTLLIEDHGPGIPTTDRERVFARFVRLGDEEGSGIGLAIVKKIVDLHRATITLAEPAGHSGLLVEVRFPQ